MSLFEPFYTLYLALTGDDAGAFVRGVAALWLMWSVYGALFVGVGAFVGRGWGLRLDGVTDVFRAFWLGWAVNLALLQVWHLFRPIDTGAFVMLAAFGLIGLVWRGRELWRIVRRAPRAWPTVAAFGVFALLLANGAMGPPSFGDFALYHQQAILWAQAEPLVVGLGNLHGRLAFNNASFLYAAQTDTAPIAGIGNHVASSLLIVVMLAWGLVGWRRVMRGDVSPVALVTLLTLPVTLWTTANNEHLRTPDNDLPPLLLGLVTAIALTTILTYDERDNQRADIALLIVLAAAGVVGKLSFAVMGGTAVLVALIAARPRLRGLWMPLALGVAIVGVWMGRGVLLSGYPLYPSTVAAFPVDWRVPCDDARAEAEAVYVWARQPFGDIESVRGGGWLASWLVRTLRRDMEVVTPLIVLAVSLAYRWRLRRRLSRSWWLMAVPLASLAFWFIAAPDPRFAGASLWLLGYGAAALTLADWGATHPQTARSVALMLALLLSYETRETFLTYLPTDGSAFYPTQAAQVESYTTDSGLQVNVPAPSIERPDEDRCYAAALPCTPYFDASLELRGETFRDGFRTPRDAACH